MIDSEDDYKNFLEECRDDDLFLYLILTDDREHPCTEKPCILFVVNCRNEKIYHFSINHQDAPKVVEWYKLISDIEKLNGKKFVLDKKSFLQHGKIEHNLLDINLALHLKNDNLINNFELETNAHRFVRQNFYSYPLHNKIVPLMKHKEVALIIFRQINKLINCGIIRDKSYLKINNEIIPVLSELESNGIFINIECFNKHFQSKVHKGYVYSQYNLYTSTGRPSNRFGGVNYAALKKDNGSRSCFVSRFGDDGTMMMIDYSAFHPHIICELTKFDISNDVDFYSYMAKLCFKKNIIDDDDIKKAKELSFRQLYGGVEEGYSHIKFFHNLKSFIDSHWKEYQQKGYTTTPFFGRKIKNVVEPNPSKIFNYILQATETEISVPILGKINSYLRDKNSKAVLYTYDSVLFDINFNEMDVIKPEIISIMKDNNRFPIKCYVGKSYNDLNQISV